MVTPIASKAAIGELAPRRPTLSGRLAANRQLRGVAISGALVLAVVATLVVGQAFRSDQAARTAPIPVAAEEPSFTAAVSDTTAAGLREFLGGEQVAGAIPTARGAVEMGPQEFLAGDGSTRSLPSVSTTPSYTYDDEGMTQRGAGTTGGNSESCAYPVGLCDR